ncbi:MAG: hypothetical protein KDD39_06930 [Bdellovibrionales bacterium]|nr:hypothetical protein [Bdellovibrionales bacterium]
MKALILGLVGVVTLLSSASAYADANACDDYIARHYKKDLVPLGITYWNKEWMGDIHFPHQRAIIKVKNTGEVGFTGSGYKRMKVRVGNSTEEVQIAMPIASGALREVTVILPPGTLSHCKEEEVAIDTIHNVGQWGCQVWNNDQKDLKAIRSGGPMCLKIGPIKPGPIQPIKP